METTNDSRTVYAGNGFLFIVGLLPTTGAAALLALGYGVSALFSEGALNLGALVLTVLAVAFFAAATLTLIAFTPLSRRSADVAAVSAATSAFALSAAGYAPLAAFASCLLVALGCIYCGMRAGIVADDESGLFDTASESSSLAALAGMFVMVAALAAIVAIPWFRGWHLVTLLVAAVWYDRHVILARRIADRKAGAA